MSKKPKAHNNRARNVETSQLPPRPQQQASHRQALQFIDAIAALAPVSRQEHVRVQSAIQQMSGAIKEG